MVLWLDGDSQEYKIAGGVVVFTLLMVCRERELKWGLFPVQPMSAIVWYGYAKRGPDRLRLIPK